MAASEGPLREEGLQGPLLPRLASLLRSSIPFCSQKNSGWGRHSGRRWRRRWRTRSSDGGRWRRTSASSRSSSSTTSPPPSERPPPSPRRWVPVASPMALLFLVWLHYYFFQSGFALSESALLQARKWKARPLRDAGVEPLRQSGRVSNLPEKPDYRSGRKVLPDRGSATNEERRHAITKAQELAEKLDSRFPIFVKSITKYYASGGFVLEHLPERDERITLEDEEGHEYSTTYLTGSLCLSAGWRRFANQHKLVDGDCLVFQLIKTTKLKNHLTYLWLECTAGRAPQHIPH